jgi:hypothetical protein
MSAIRVETNSSTTSDSTAISSAGDSAGMAVPGIRQPLLGLRGVGRAADQAAADPGHVDQLTATWRVFVDPRRGGRRVHAEPAYCRGQPFAFSCSFCAAAESNIPAASSATAIPCTDAFRAPSRRPAGRNYATVQRELPGAGDSAGPALPVPAVGLGSSSGHTALVEPRSTAAHTGSRVRSTNVNRCWTPAATRSSRFDDCEVGEAE